MSDAAVENRFCCGDNVLIAGGTIPGTVEEIILVRGMLHPVYLVQWWNDGRCCTARFVPDDVQAAR